MALPLAPPLFAFAFVVTCASAWVQGVVGFGFSVVAVPVLALAAPELVPVPQLLMSFPLAVLMFTNERSAVDWRGLGWMLLARVPGLVLGAALLALAPAKLVSVFLALAVLAAVVMLATGRATARTTMTYSAAGFLSGVMSFVSAIGGPPIALLYRDAKGPVLRATLAAVFSVGTLMTIGARVLANATTWRDVELAVWLLPALLFGLVLSRKSAATIEGPALRRAVLAIATASAVGVLARTLVLS